MPTNTPPFNEKEFLLGLLSIVENEHGKELRFIMEHKFDSIDLDILNHLPTLKKLSSDIAIKKFISQWFAEAEKRNLVTPLRPQHYKLSGHGYKLSLAKKSPISQFIENNPKYVITTTITFAAAIFAIIRLIKC